MGFEMVLMFLKKPNGNMTAGDWSFDLSSKPVHGGTS